MKTIIPQRKSNEISFLFGGIDDDETYDMVEVFAINYSISFDNAKFRYFCFMTDEFGVPKNSNENYYQAVFREMTQRKVLLPKICHGTYKENGNIYPKIILTNNYVVDIKTNEICPFTNPYLINRFGKNLGENIGFEYLRHEGV
jgi:hypothetical protein